MSLRIDACLPYFWHKQAFPLYSHYFSYCNLWNKFPYKNNLIDFFFGGVWKPRRCFSSLLIFRLWRTPLLFPHTTPPYFEILYLLLVFLLTKLSEKFVWNCLNNKSSIITSSTVVVQWSKFSIQQMLYYTTECMHWYNKQQIVLSLNFEIIVFISICFRSFST